MTHILNGDSLLKQFSASIEGNKIVCRECLVDGTKFPLDLDALFKERWAYLSAQYPQDPTIDYNSYVKAEFDKILELPNKSEVVLWFEDDVFCQVNFWFCTYLLSLHDKQHKLYLVRPAKHTPYGFGGLSEQHLLIAYERRREITRPLAIASLWKAYCNRDMAALLDKAYTLKEPEQFIYNAADAYVQSLPDGDNPGRPTRSLKAIKEALKTDSFGLIFKAFCEQEAIYGFGDLQVKKLLEALD